MNVLDPSETSLEDATLYIVRRNPGASARALAHRLVSYGWMNGDNEVTTRKIRTVLLNLEGKGKVSVDRSSQMCHYYPAEAVT